MHKNKQTKKTETIHQQRKQKQKQLYRLYSNSSSIKEKVREKKINSPITTLLPGGPLKGRIATQKHSPLSFFEAGDF